PPTTPPTITAVAPRGDPSLPLVPPAPCARSGMPARSRSRRAPGARSPSSGLPRGGGVREATPGAAAACAPEGAALARGVARSGGGADGIGGRDGRLAGSASAACAPEGATLEAPAACAREGIASAAAVAGPAVAGPAVAG